VLFPLALAGVALLLHAGPQGFAAAGDRQAALTALEDRDAGPLIADRQALLLGEDRLHLRRRGAPDLGGAALGHGGAGGPQDHRQQGDTEGLQQGGGHGRTGHRRLHRGRQV
jgi:hypothetical protein